MRGLGGRKFRLIGVVAALAVVLPGSLLIGQPTARAATPAAPKVTLRAPTATPATPATPAAPKATPADAPTPTITALRTIGGPGHAYLYGWGTAVETDGTILVGDYWNFQIRKLNPVTGADEGIFGDFNSGTQGFGSGFHQSPYGIAVSPTNGDVYVGDVDNHSLVDHYNSAGTFINSWGGTGTGTGKFNYPARMAVANDGSYVVVSDQRLNQLVFDDPSGNELFRVGKMGTALGQLNSPRGVAFAPNGQLYVADAFNHRVVVYNVNIGAKTATAVSQFGSQGTNPGQFSKASDLRGLAIDQTNGWVYVSDASGGYVDKFDLSGNYLLRIGGYGSVPGKMSAGGREVAVDHNSNIWVGDLPDFSVQQFTSSGNSLLDIPSPASPPPNGLFNSPLDVATNAQGDMYVADEHNQRIQELDSQGNFIRAWGTRGSGNLKFNYPRGLAVVQSNGDVVVADTDNDQIKEYGPTGTWIWTSGKYGTGAGTGQFSHPHAISVAADGSVWVADTQNWRIVHLSAAGVQIGTFGTHGTGQTQFEYPRDVAVDPTDGSLWVPDSQLGVVKHFTTAGAYLGQFGSLGSGPGQFDQVERVVVDANYVYVSDADANQVTVWDRNSLDYLTTFGGPGTHLGQMYQPHGMAFDPSTHNLLVVDQVNAWIDVFSTAALQHPVANADSATTQSGAPVNVAVLANDTDPNGASLTISSYTQPADGTVTCQTGVANGTCTYTSGAGFSGGDTFQYTVTDSDNQSATGTVNITVTALQPPVANTDSATTQSGAPVSVAVLANDTDPNGASLTISSYTQPTDGTVTCQTGVANGTCTYTSTTGFSGGDTFQYTVTDSDSQSATGTVNITVTAVQSPVANTDSATTQSDTPVNVAVLANDTDPNGGSLTITSYTQPADGTVTCQTGVANGTCTYTSNAGFGGPDTFQYTITDSIGQTATGTVNVTVQAPLSEIGGIGGPENAEIYPSGVDYSVSDSTLVVTDIGNNQVKKFDTNGTLVWAVGSQGSGTNQFDHPRDVGVDPVTGNIYVADADNSRIVELDTNGNWITSFSGPAGDQISFPLGVSFANGQVIVADTGRKKVRVFDTNGNPGLEFASSGNCQMADLRDATEDSSGNFYTADYTANTISRFNPDGTCDMTWGSKGSGQGQLAAPYGIAVGNDPVTGAQEIYVADANNERMEEFDTSGNYLAIAGSPGPDGASGSGTMFQMRKVAVAPDGSVYTADLWGWLVDHYTRSTGGYTYDSSIGTVLATPTSNSVFDEPRGISFESDGSIWVADTVHQRIEHLSQSGQLINYCGIRGAALGAFNWPRGIAVDPATGNLWVADTKSYRIQLLKEPTANGVVVCDGGLSKIGGFGTALGQFNWVYSDAVDPADSTLWVVDNPNNRIVSINMKTKAVIAQYGLPLAGGKGTGSFNSPSGIAYDPYNGYILVADSLNNRIDEFSESAGSNITLVGSVGTPTSTVFNNPMGVAADQYGHIYVADTGNNRVVVLNSDLSTNAVITGSFDDPENVAFNTSDDLLYVADTGNDQIVEYAGFGGGTPPPPPDTTPPTVTVSTPAAGSTVAVPVSVTGNIADNQSVASVALAFKDRTSGLYYQANGTWSSTYTKFAATVASPGTTSSGWSYSWSPGSGGSGSYTLLVTGTDTAGNTTPTKVSVNFATSP